MSKKTDSLIILAGGKSRRMGRDKADIEWNGQTFLEILTEKGIALGMKHILVSGYRGEKLPVHVTNVADLLPGHGPLGGLMSTLRTCAGIREGNCLVLGVDSVLLTVSELQKLINAAEASDQPVTILSHKERQEPLIGVYDSCLGSQISEEDVLQNRSVFSLLNKTGFSVYQSNASEDLFRNLNTPEELRWAQEHFDHKDLF